MDSNLANNTFFRRYCLFCYKPYEISSAENDSPTKSNLAGNFFKVLEKSNGKIKLPKSLLNEPRSELEKAVAGAVHSVCNDCVTVVRKYVALYGDLECLQLRLKWQIVQLYKIMRASRRVPSRVKEFEENIGRNDFTLPKDNGMVEHLRLMINEFRGKIYKTFSSTSKVKNPQVLLHRLSLEREDSHPTLNIDSYSLPEELSEESNGRECPSSSVIDIEERSANNFISMHDFKTENTNGQDAGESDQIDEKIGDSDIIVNASSLKSEEIGLQNVLLEEDYPENFDEHDILDNDLNHSGEEMETELSKDSVDDKIAKLHMNGEENCAVVPRGIFNPNDTKRNRRKNAVGEKGGKSSPVTRNAKKVANKSKSVLTKISESKSTSQVVVKDEFDKKTEDNISSPSSQNPDAQIEDVSCSESESDDKSKKSRRNRVRTCKAKNYPCTFTACKTRCSSEVNLQAHLLTHGSFPCNFCDFKGDQVRTLALHELSTHSILSKDHNWVQCSRCSVKFTGFRMRDNVITGQTGSFYDHYLTKHFNIPGSVIREDKCHICGREYQHAKTSSRAMKRHIKECHDIEGKDEESIFRCQKCNAPFLTDYQRQMHVWKDHGLRFSCVPCELTFPNRVKYRIHMREHSKEGEFKCNITGCGQTFYSKNSLNFHNAAHKGKSKLIWCPKPRCSRTFMNEYSLRVHLNTTHNGKPKTGPIIKKYCEKCDKEFVGSSGSLKSRLKKHMESHFHDGQSSWQFSCEVCGKMCQNPFKLEEHMRTHSKAKPFTCEYCGRNFSIQYNLKRHIKLVHKVQPPAERTRKIPDEDSSGRDQVPNPE